MSPELQWRVPSCVHLFLRRSVCGHLRVLNVIIPVCARVLFVAVVVDVVVAVVVVAVVSVFVCATKKSSSNNVNVK